MLQEFFGEEEGVVHEENKVAVLEVFGHMLVANGVREAASAQIIRGNKSSWIFSHKVGHLSHGLGPSTKQRHMEVGVNLVIRDAHRVVHFQKILQVCSGGHVDDDVNNFASDQIHSLIGGHSSSVERQEDVGRKVHHL